MRRKLLTLLLAIATILQAIPMNIIAEQTENDYGVVGAYKAYSLSNALYEPNGAANGVANDVIYIKKNNDNDASKGMPAYCFNATKSIVDVYDSTPDFGDLTEPMPTYTKINGGINNKFADLADNEILNNNSDLVSAVLKVIYNGYRENDGNRVEEIKNAYKNSYGDTVSDVEIYAATQKAIWYYTDGVKEFELNDDRIGKSITTKVLRLYRFLIGKEDHGLGLTLNGYTGAQTLDLYMPDRGQKDNALPYQNLLGTDLVDKKGSPDVKKYNITVKKVDEEGNELLAGATLELKSEDNIIYRWKTNTTENNKLSNPRTFYLQPGRYTLSEVSAPEGYRKAEPKTFTVGENGKVNGATEIVMTNKKIPVMSIQVSKKWQDENGGEYNDTDFLNVKIKLKADDKDALDASGNNIEPILLLKNNKWTYEFKNLPVYHTGKENLENEKIKYTVEELDIPEGFEWTVGRDTVITGNGNEKNEISLVNKKKVEPEEPKVQNEAHIHKIQVNKTWSELNKKSKKPVYFELWKVVDGVESKVIDSDLGGGKLENPVKLNEMTSSVAWTNVYVNEELTKKNFVFKVKEVDDMGNPWEDKENGYSKEDTKIIEVVNPTAKLFTVTNTYKKVDNEKNITISKVKIGGTELKDAKIEIRNESGDQLAKGKIDGVAGDLKWTSTETAKEIE
ncbi:Cys-Gln thioester bond-forming surface protein, partial [Peptostreptococcus anaerobius]|uniref:Cys-Gln thioester bond-forming surface protein n=1 Tax=Peptostreptococcus anaerobius TaxID=1261 RepID=UPI0034A507F6